MEPHRWSIGKKPANASQLASRRAVRLVLLAEAEAELEEAASWYDDRRQRLGDELLLSVHSAFIVVSETPEAWPRWPDLPERTPDIRRFVLPRFHLRLAYQAFA